MLRSLKYFLVSLTNPQFSFKSMLARTLLFIPILYHFYITGNNEQQSLRFRINSTNNLHKYFGQGSIAFTYLSIFIRQFNMFCFLGSSCMLISRWIGWKILAIIGILMYNVLILNYHVMVTNYYAIREWIGIIGGIVGIWIIDWEYGNRVRVEEERERDRVMGIVRDKEKDGSQSKMGISQDGNGRKTGKYKNKKQC